MKNCIYCGKLNENILMRWCRDCYLTEVRPKEIRKPRKAIKKVSTKKKQRLKETGGEASMFRNIFKKRKICELCGTRVIEPKPWCFAHILSKAMFPHLRMLENNIFFVCGESCHKDLDSKIAGNNKKEIEGLILSGKTINIKDYE